MSDKVDVTIEKKDTGLIDDLEIKGLPTYMESITLDKEQKRRLMEDWKDEFKAICKERKKKKFEDKIYSLRRQYEGIVPDTMDLDFNLHKHTTKTKCDVVRRHMLQAFLEPEPRVSITPRPEFQRRDGEDITEDIEDFIDYAIDERMNTFRPTLSKVFKDAIGSSVGIMKVCHRYREVKKKRPERFSTVQEFLDKYPNGKKIERYQSIINDLIKLEERNAIIPPDKKKYLEYMADYSEVVYDDPYPTWVDPINFYCRMSVDNYDDLKFSRFKSEEKEYTWWELKQLEKEGILSDVDMLKYENVKAYEGMKNYSRPDKLKIRKGYQYETYKIMENDFCFKLSESDEEETHISFWHDKDKDIILGCSHYPYYYVDCCYFPFWIDDSTQGWAKRSLAEYMTESNMAEDIMLNLMLQYFYIRSTLTPISSENSPTHKQFMERRWTWGMNIDTDGQPLHFAQEYLQNVSAQEMIHIIQYMVQGDDEVTAISSLMSGRESPIDPKAPAAKTIALLEKSGISIKDYVQCLGPCFDEMVNAIMMFYYQYSEDKGIKFRRRASKVTGNDDLFGELKRSDMVARVNVQTQARIFNFEKKNEKQEDLALLQILRSEPLIANNPEAVYILIKNIIKGWSPKWRKLVEKILPPIDKFRQDQLKLVIQGVSMYAEQKAAEAMATGKPQPALDAQELLAGIQGMLKETATAPSEEEIKEREKAQKEGAMVR